MLVKGVKRGPDQVLGHISSTRVAFKGCRKGLRLVLSPEDEFNAIMADLADKLAATGDFFRGAQVWYDGDSRRLAEGEIAQLRGFFQERQIELLIDKPAGSAQFLPPTEGTVTVRAPIRSGQRVMADGNVLILGDVHPGAEIMAGLDVIVLGAAKGRITAGIVSGREASVFAFQLRPALLRLGDLAASSPGTGPAWRAEVARVRDGRIVVEAFDGWQRAGSRRQQKH